MKIYKTAVIGTGFVGVAHIEALRRLGNVKIIAICDTFGIEEKAKKLFVKKAYTDYKKMIDELDLDFVHICTPNYTHYPIAKYALEHDINVVLEKPLTLNISEALNLTKLAKSRNLINAVNYHNRMYPAPSFSKRFIESNKIGNIFLVNGVYIQDWLLYDTDYSWRLNSNESGITRAVADIGSHWIDLVEYITGLKIVEVFAEFKTVFAKRKKPTGNVESFSNEKTNNYSLINIDTEDMALVMFRFENEAIGNLTISQMSAGIKNRIDLLISGTNASLEWKLDDLSNVKIGYRDKADEIYPKDLSLMKNVKNLIDYPAGHMEGFPDAFKQNFKQIYSQPEHKSYATFEDGLRQMILNQKIYDSAKEHKWIKIME